MPKRKGVWKDSIKLYDEQCYPNSKQTTGSHESETTHLDNSKIVLSKFSQWGIDPCDSQLPAWGGIKNVESDLLELTAFLWSPRSEMEREVNPARGENQ